MPNFFKNGWEYTIDSMTANAPAFVRICIIAGKSFFYYHGMTRAAALTYTTLLAAIPLLILLTSIVLYVGFGSLFSDYLSILENIDSYHSLLMELEPILKNAEHVPVDKLGLVGTSGLFVTFLLAIGSLEINFNVVWENKISRSLIKQCFVYTPILIVCASIIGLFAGFAKHLHDVCNSVLVQNLHFDASILVALKSVFWFSILNAAIFIIIFLILFALPYRPNKYPIKKLLLTSFLATLISMIAIYIYAWFLSFIQTSLFARMSLFYGSLAFIPLLLLLVFGIWSIILFANSLVWTICNWPHVQERKWNWNNSIQKL